MAPSLLNFNDFRQKLKLEPREIVGRDNRVNFNTRFLLSLYPGMKRTTTLANFPYFLEK